MIAQSSECVQIQAVLKHCLELALRHATGGEATQTAISSLQILQRRELPSRVYSVHRPALCLIAQGAKEVTVGSTVFRYRRGEFLLSTVELPVTGEVVEASPHRPYVCLALDIEPNLIFELLSAGVSPAPSNQTTQGMFVGQSDAQLIDAFLRLLRCLDNPLDVAVLAPGVLREIAYRLLLGPYGAAVRDLGVAGSQTQRIARAVEMLKRDFDRALPVEELARVAGMSVSSFHAHFRKVTSLSPLQYQKRLRLQEARRQLLAQTAGAADVGFRVGYESASQFSREYARLFGAPPLSDVKRTLAAMSSKPTRAVR